MAILECRDLCKTYGAVQALERLEKERKNPLKKLFGFGK